MEVGAAAPPEIEFAPLIDGECISPGFQGRLRVVELYRESGPFWESVRDMCARWEIEARPQLQANGPGIGGLMLSRRSDEEQFLRFPLLHPLMPLRAMPSITYRWAMRKTIRTGMLAITPPAMITA